MYAHWYRCKFFNVYDEYQPWNWNSDNDFEYDFDQFYEPFYLFYNHPKSLVTNDGKCDTYAKDITAGYPEYLGGAILTPNIIYMETQEYYLNYTKDDDSSGIDEQFYNDCDENGTNEEYTKGHYTANEEYTQYVHDYIQLASDLPGLSFKTLRNSETNNVDASKYCYGYASGFTSDVTELNYCQFYDTQESFTSEVHKYQFVHVPRAPRIRPQTPCDTVIFDYYEDQDRHTKILILGWWQSLSKGTSLFSYRAKTSH